MRETCLFCTSKHLAQAIVLVNEAPLGYPLHLWLAVGHLAEAETECLSECPDLAQDIRKVRCALMGQKGEFKHEDLMNLLAQARRCAEEVNDLPEEVRVKEILFPTPKKMPPVKEERKKQQPQLKAPFRGDDLDEED